MSSHKAAALPSAWGHSHVAHVQQLIQRQFLDWARMRRQGLRWYFWDALGVLFSELRYRGRYRSSFPKPDPKHYLANAAPYCQIHLDIGCGNGEWLIRKAMERPTTHFVGLDHDRNMLYKSVLRATQAFRISPNALSRFPNVTWMYADANFLPSLFPQQFFDSISLHYPSPYRDIERHFTNGVPYRDVVTPHLIKAVHYVLKDNGTFTLCTETQQRALQILQLCSKDGLPLLYKSRIPPPYYTETPPDPSYGLKPLNPNSRLDGHHMPKRAPSVRVHLNYDLQEANKIAGETSGSTSVSFQQRVQELQKHILFGYPSDWNLPSEGVMPPRPTFPTIHLKGNACKDTMNEKQVFWNLLSKYYEQYEATLTQATVAVTLAADPPHSGVASTDTARLSSSSSSSLSSAWDIPSSWHTSPEQQGTMMPPHQCIDASLPISNAATNDAVTVRAFQSDSNSVSTVETVFSTLAHRNEHQPIKRSPTETREKPIGTMRNRDFPVNNSCFERALRQKDDNLVSTTAPDPCPEGYALGHASVAALRSIHIPYKSVPPATLSSTSRAPYLAPDVPLVQPVRKRHYIILDKVPTLAPNDLAVSQPWHCLYKSPARQHRTSLEAVVASPKPRLLPRRSEQRCGLPASLRINKFRRVTRRGRRQLYHIFKKENQKRQQQEWMHEKQRILDGCKVVAVGERQMIHSNSKY